MRLRVVLWCVLLVAAIGLIGFSQWLEDLEEEGNCTAIIVGKDASIDGSVMTTHTCDGWYDSRLWVIPGGAHEPGEMVDVWVNRLHADRRGREPEVVGEIPQVAVTYTYFQIGYPFMNENQVMIGEHTFGGERALRNPEGGLFDVEELEALGLQRATTARECIQIMGALAEEYGYGDGGECLTVCDENEGWVFEIMGAGPLWRQGDAGPGAVWAAKRVPDNGFYAGGNRAQIGQIDLSDPDNYMAGTGIYSVGEALGLWDPTAGKTFRFWEVYAPKESFYNSRREWRARDLVAPSLELDAYARRYPFFVVPDEKLTVADVMAIKRDYYAGTDFDLSAGLSAGPFGTPDRHSTSRSLNPEGSVGWERAISMFRCSYSFVSQSRNWLPDPIGGVLWFGPDTPHTTCYMPIYCGVTSVPESLQIMSRYEFSRDSAWWAFNFVEDWSNLAFSYMIEDIRALQQKFEGEFFAMQSAVEGAALALYERDPALGISYLTNYTGDAVNRVVSAWWDLADDLVAKYSDGYTDYSSGSKGYPEEWLEAVGFGATTMLEDYKDIWYGEWEPDE